MVAILIIIGLLAYFLPTVIAMSRSHKDGPAIAAINILLGWTVFGWFTSFIWSLSDPRGRGVSQTIVVNANTTALSGAATGPAAAYVPAPAPAALLTGGAASSGLADPDTAFWDSMANKSDPDQLEEYLIRFPAGRFAQLAHARLQRLGLLPAPAEPPLQLQPVAGEPPAEAAKPADPPALAACASCAAALEPESRFCDDCGSPVAAFA